MNGGLSEATLPTNLPDRIRHRVGRSVRVIRGLTGRRDSFAVLFIVSALYLVAFLFMLNDVVVQTGAGFSVFVVDGIVETMLQPAPGPFLYRPVALLELWVVVWEFSPLNTLLGGGLALLVGLNMAASYLAVVQPRSCGISASTGVLASIPALFAGSACCAPVIVLILGLQVSGTLITAFTWLLPVSITLLVVTLFYVTGKIDEVVLAE